MSWPSEWFKRLTANAEVLSASPQLGMQELSRSLFNHCFISPRCNGYLALGNVSDGAGSRFTSMNFSSYWPVVQIEMTNGIQMNRIQIQIQIYFSNHIVHTYSIDIEMTLIWYIMCWNVVECKSQDCYRHGLAFYHNLINLQNKIQYKTKYSNN